MILKPSHPVISFKGPLTALLCNTILRAFIACGDFSSCKALFGKMVKKSGSECGNEDLFTNATFILLFKAAAKLESIQLAEEVRLIMEQKGLEGNSSPVIVALLGVYRICGAVSKATQLFEEQKQKDIYMYTVMIQTHFECETPISEISRLFSEMRQNGISLDAPFFALVLNGCGRTKSFEFGGFVLDLMMKESPDFQRHWDVAYALIKFFANWKGAEAGFAKFDQLTHNKPSGNILVSACIQICRERGEAFLNEAFKFLHQIEEPNHLIIASLLNYCTDTRAFLKSKQIEALSVFPRFQSNPVVIAALIRLCALEHGFESAYQKYSEFFCDKTHLDVFESLFSAYRKTNDFESALKLFAKFKALNTKPSNTTDTIYVHMLHIYASAGDYEQINLMVNSLLQVPRSMPLSGSLLVTIVDMLAKYSSVTKAMSTWYRWIPKLDHVHPAVWNDFFRVCVEHYDEEKLRKILQQLRQAGHVNSSTVVSLLSNSPSFAMAEEMYIQEFKSEFLEDLRTLCALIQFYGRFGAIEKAESTFSEYRKNRGAVTAFDLWKAMISVYVDGNRLSDAIRLMEEMKNDGIEPDATIFISVCDLCARIGTRDDGEKIHAVSHDTPGIRVNLEVVRSLILMLAKCGDLTAAESVYDTYPGRVAEISAAMATAYNAHGQHLLALNLFPEHILEFPSPQLFSSALEACVKGRFTIRIMSEIFRFMKKYHVELEPERSHCEYLLELYKKGTAESVVLVKELLPLAWRTQVLSMLGNDDAPSENSSEFFTLTEHLPEKE